MRTGRRSGRNRERVALVSSAATVEEYHSRPEPRQGGRVRTGGQQIARHKTLTAFDRYHLVNPAALCGATQKFVGAFSGTSATSALAPTPANALNYNPRPGSSIGRVPAF